MYTIGLLLTTSNLVTINNMLPTVYPLVLQYAIFRNFLQQNVSTDSPTTFLQTDSKRTTYLVTNVAHLNMFISFGMFHRDSFYTPSPIAQSYRTKGGENKVSNKGIYN